MHLDRKQKILLPVTVVVLGVLGWQLYGLLGTHSNKNTQLPSAYGASSALVAESAAIPAMPVSSSTNTASSLVSEQDRDRLRAVSADDTEYLKLVQEYQLLQIQRRIAEDARAIAIAKLETARAVAETTKVGGVSNFTNGLERPTVNSEHDYKLVFTGQEAGQWTATLKINEQLIDVVPGTVLPDGYKVISVEGDNVIMQNGGFQRQVSFLGIHDTKVDDSLAVNTDATAKQVKADALLQAIAPEPQQKTEPVKSEPAKKKLNKS